MDKMLQAEGSVAFVPDTQRSREEKRECLETLLAKWRVGQVARSEQVTLSPLLEHPELCFFFSLIQIDNPNSVLIFNQMDFNPHLISKQCSAVTLHEFRSP